MIEANKNLIKSTLTQSVLGIHSKLIQLYQFNLSTIATQAALIAGFSSSALGYNYAEITSLPATVVVTFGPSFALKGKTSDSVKIAAIHIIFKDSEDDKLLEGEEVHNGRLNRKGNYSLVNTYPNGDNTMSFAELIENTKLKARGVIWKRRPVEHGGLFIKYYAVLEKGKLDFYKSLQDYKDYSNPINPSPYKLWELDIETDYNKFEKKVSSLRRVLTSTLVGNDEFTLSDIMSSDYDLKYASKNYRFALIPKVVSELSLHSITELMAQDEEAYNLWTSALRTVIEAYHIIAKNPSVEQTMRVGTSSVNTVVLAVNK
eukprot:gene20426-26506_t